MRVNTLTKSLEDSNDLNLQRRSSLIKCLTICASKKEHKVLNEKGPQ